MLRKLLLVSILFANVAIPIWAARERSSRQGLKKLIVSMLLFDLVYVAALVVLYPRL
jgi:hypothetical protein